MEEFEYGSYYLWPTDHDEGKPIPDEWWDHLHEVLTAAGISYEPI